MGVSEGAGAAGDPAGVLAHLDPEQRVAAAAVSGPVCILAGAGTGKTRTITHRIAYGVHSGQFAPEAVLAVTFTVRAAGELRSRLRALGVAGVQARTFHSAALRQLEYFWPKAFGTRPPPVAESPARLLAAAAAREGVRLAGPALADVLGEIGWAKATLVGPADYPVAVAAAGREPPREVGEVARLYAAYDRACAEAGVVDFDQILLLAAGLVEERPDVARELRARYRHFVVDEFQDVSPLQYRLLTAWLGERDELCVVGDANQTIYSFTGATPRYLLEFPERFPGARVVRLERDYRSTEQVTQLANRVIAGDRSLPEGARLRLRAQRGEGPEPVEIVAADEESEAAQVAARIRALLDSGLAAADIAVLYRTNTQSRAYEEALARAGIPYLVRGGQRFFARPEVREALLLLRGAARAQDLRTGPERNGRGLAELVAEVLASRGFTPDTPPAGARERERWENLAALTRLAATLEAERGRLELRDYVAELTERVADGHAPEVDGVTLASLHAAKGLEWEAVFLVGLADGLLPLSRAGTAAALAEERRLLYVGLTRARTYLGLSWAPARSAGGARRPRGRCRFLDDALPAREPLAGGGPATAGSRRAGARTAGASRGSAVRAGGAGSAGGRAGSGTRATCRGCGSALTTGGERRRGRCAGCPSPADPELLARLKRWRSGRAAQLRQPAYCVFTDATLAVIAEERPRDTTELASLPGVGAVKLERFGAEVLAILAQPAEK